mmetsp:Transcript_10993/g.20271  ORF Transcript_10993/g.20271 Transcript_10993/m.20271 type:complete len:433 (-) Transcript_10993:1117-2415(-)
MRNNQSDMLLIDQIIRIHIVRAPQFLTSIRHRIMRLHFLLLTHTALFPNNAPRAHGLPTETGHVRRCHDQVAIRITEPERPQVVFVPQQKQYVANVIVVARSLVGIRPSESASFQNTRLQLRQRLPPESRIDRHAQSTRSRQQQQRFRPNLPILHTRLLPREMANRSFHVVHIRPIGSVIRHPLDGLGQYGMSGSRSDQAVPGAELFVGVGSHGIEGDEKREVFGEEGIEVCFEHHVDVGVESSFFVENQATEEIGLVRSGQKRIKHNQESRRIVASNVISRHFIIVESVLPPRCSPTILQTVQLRIHRRRNFVKVRLMNDPRNPFPWKWHSRCCNRIDAYFHIDSYLSSIAAIFIVVFDASGSVIIANGFPEAFTANDTAFGEGSENGSFETSIAQPSWLTGPFGLQFLLNGFFSSSRDIALRHRLGMGSF